MKSPGESLQQGSFEGRTWASLQARTPAAGMGGTTTLRRGGALWCSGKPLSTSDTTGAEERPQMLRLQGPVNQGAEWRVPVPSRLISRHDEVCPEKSEARGLGSIIGQ